MAFQCSNKFLETWHGKSLSVVQAFSELIIHCDAIVLQGRTKCKRLFCTSFFQEKVENTAVEQNGEAEKQPQHSHGNACQTSVNQRV